MENEITVFEWYCNISVIWGRLQQNQTKWTFYKWGADYDVVVKLTSVTDDVLKSNNGAHSQLMDLLILMFTLSYQNVMNINHNMINIGLSLLLYKKY